MSLPCPTSASEFSVTPYAITVPSPALLSTDLKARICNFNATNLSPHSLIKHLAIYGPRDPAVIMLSPGTHYSTTSGFTINFFSKQGIRRDGKVKNAFVLVFDDEHDRFQCRLNLINGQIEVQRLEDSNSKSISLVMDTIHDGDS